MAKHGVTKRNPLSGAPSKPSASAPSSGGASAPGVVFDYCPTDFTKPEAKASPQPAIPQETEAPRHPPMEAVQDAHARPREQLQAQQETASSVAREPKAPKQEKAKPDKTMALFASQSLGLSSSFANATAAIRFSLRAFDAAQANLNASFEFAKRVAAAKSLGEVLELQTAYLNQQFANVTAQTKEMAEFARSLSPLSALTPTAKH